MIHSQASAAASALALAPASYAAGTNNGGWIDARAYQGGILVSVANGSVTGSVVFKVQHASDSGGTGAADITGATTASISSFNQVNKIVLNANDLAGWIRVVATVTTGPVLAGATVHANPGIV